MQATSPEYWISKLELNAHPEGGYYKRTYQGEEKITDQELSVEFNGHRWLYTSIYFLLRSQDISHFHRLKSDELWYYHAGSPLTIHVIHENGTYEEIKLGSNLEKGETMQYLVPKNSIFGSSVLESDTFSLVGCMVAPGFDFQDFELFTQQELLAQYPEHHEVIRKVAYEKIPVGV
ncbi:cupin domain-containing protein [Paenibacillus sp. NPDC057967]|uniref:cupin domain-containing protein n=1 Tax=Paenibacillus sp. NPDC057967 TaxID=3346293 RepID=UPI0036D820EB